jgi:hypothetical protein
MVIFDLRLLQPGSKLRVHAGEFTIITLPVEALQRIHAPDVLLSPSAQDP